MKKPNKPKVLVYDIEVSPNVAFIWRLWDQNVSLSQLESEWHVMSWAAKWLDEDKVMYADQRKKRKMEDDRAILKKIWKLLDQADVVITYNGKKFDEKKLNARFLLHGFKPPSSYQHLDLYKVAKKHFGFNSNKLSYLTDKLCEKHKKSDHKKFPGIELWRECLARNEEAWKEMEKYNKLDVLSLEELYHKIIPWDNSINFNLYHDEDTNVCKCGSTDFAKNGFAYTPRGKFQRYTCKKCGAEGRTSKNLLSKEKLEKLHNKITK